MTRSAVTVLNPAGLPDPRALAYSQLAVIEPGASLVFVAGQVGDHATADFAHQVRTAFEGMLAALATQGLGADAVAQLTAWIVGHDEARHRVLIAEVGRVFGDLPPPCTIVPLAQSGTDPKQLFEVTAIAAALT